MKKMKTTFISLALCIMCASVKAQTVSVADVEALPGETVSFTLDLSGGKAETYIALQFDVHFPNNNFTTTGDYSVSSKWKNATSVVGSVDGDGVATIHVSSAETISDANVGGLITIDFTVGSNVPVGEYDVTLKNIWFGYGISSKDYVDDVTFKVNVVAQHTVVLDELSTTAPEKATGVNVTVKRTINANEWSTICLPFDMSEAHDRPGQIDLFTEVIQEACLPLLKRGKLGIASGTALTLSEAAQKEFVENSAEWKKHFILRQQEVSNSPDVIRRLGVISMNTALEMDIFGNVNSSLVCGSAMMNGIGGSADFARNCALGFFLTPSVAKNGAISSVVPYVSHVDHTEHDTMIFVTEQGLADLRGLPAEERARLIIKNCAHPDFRDELTDVLEFGLKHAKGVHLPLALSRAFEMHNRFLETGKML